MSKIMNVHIPAEQKNFAINGAFDFWQERGASVQTVNTASNTSAYSADSFRYFTSGTTIKNYSIQRSTDVPTAAQSGFTSPFSLLYTQISAIASHAATDAIDHCFYLVEGVDYTKLHGRTVTIGFWFKASVAGTYSLALQNQAGSRSYVTTFTATAATWEFKSFTIVLDTNASYNFDNQIGLLVKIASMSGSGQTTAVLNAWQSANVNCASTATNFAATAGATIRMTQFSIVEGSMGFGAMGFQRAGRTLQQELAMCQRYYEKTYAPDVALATVTDNGRFAVVSVSANRPYLTVPFKVTKRVAPSMTIYNSATGATGSLRTEAGNETSAGVDAGTIGTNAFSIFQTGANLNAQGAYGHFVADSRQ